MNRADFIAKFVADESAVKEFPDQARRQDVAGQLFDAQMEARNSISEWPEVFYLKTLVPGLIKYEDPNIGVLYVDKEAIDRMAPTVISKPIVNLVHKTIEPKDFRSKADGLATDYFWGPDGWFRARVFIWDEDTKRTARAFANSCAFLLSEMSGAGTHNGIPYDHKLIQGEFTHIAIVKNPRLEGATNEPAEAAPPLVLNSEKEDKTSMLMKLWQKITGQEARNAIEVDPEKKYRVINGKKVSLNTLVSVHKECLAEQAKNKEIEDAKADELSEDEEVDVDGTKHTVKDMIASYTKKTEAENAEKEKEAEEMRKAEEAKNAAAEAEAEKQKAAEAQNALAAEQVRKEEERKAQEKKTLEAQNALAQAHNSKAHEKEFNDDCAECKKLGREAFNSLKEKAEKRNEPIPGPVSEPKTIHEKALEGSAAHRI